MGRGQATDAPRRRTVRPRRRLIGLAVGALAMVASSCTVVDGGTHQVDLVPLGYHFHIHQQATAQVWFLHVAVCQQNASCTLDFIEGQVEINDILDWLIGANPGKFFDDDEGDFVGALMGEVTPPNASINEPGRFGCLSGYRNTTLPWNDGDWYGAAWNGDWCRFGVPIT